MVRRTIAASSLNDRNLRCGGRPGETGIEDRESRAMHWRELQVDGVEDRDAARMCERHIRVDDERAHLRCPA